MRASLARCRPTRRGPTEREGRGSRHRDRRAALLRTTRCYLLSEPGRRVPRRRRGPGTGGPAPAGAGAGAARTITAVVRTVPPPARPRAQPRNEVRAALAIRARSVARGRSFMPCPNGAKRFLRGRSGLSPPASGRGTERSTAASARASPCGRRSCEVVRGFARRSGVQRPETDGVRRHPGLAPCGGSLRIIRGSPDAQERAS